MRFCGGAHHGDDPFDAYGYYERSIRLFGGIIEIDKPMVMAVNGRIGGSGLTFAMFGDIVFAERQVVFRDAHVLGGVVSATGPFQWPPSIGLLRAKRYLLTGDEFSAEKALEMGLVSEVVDTGTSLEHASAMAKRLAEIRPAAVQGTKRALNQWLRRAFDDVMATGLSYEFMRFPEEYAQRTPRSDGSGRSGRELNRCCFLPCTAGGTRVPLAGTAHRGGATPAAGGSAVDGSIERQRAATRGYVVSATATIDVDDLKVIDTDTHISEPPDLWTSRVPAKWRDVVPHVERNPETGYQHWRIGDYWLMGTGFYAVAGWKDFPPHGPVDLEQEGVDAGAWDPAERLRRMDQFGIHAQILYPNLIGFETNQFIRLGHDVSPWPASRRTTTSRLSSPAPTPPGSCRSRWCRSGTSTHRSRRSNGAPRWGHRGILFANKYEQIGLPAFTDPHWDPIYATVQDLDVSVNFHVGFSSSTDGSAAAMKQMLANFSAPAAAVGTAIGLMSNGESIAKIVTSGLCDRFPTVPFVSVESGFGFLPYLLESLDWHWKGYGAMRDHPMLPSEYFRRQCYGTFWFETSTLPLLSTYPDNFMFETDYPHPTSMSPGPASPAEPPNVHIAKHFADVPADITRKVLHGNAARLYHLD